ncbi:hypothetical protein HQ39_00735 [Porphyromonas sp. COT-108 OH2963]|nr:hypothetical protein HQ39_00735 [Porphyromonas sp. COT-108 OH2963]
MIFILLIYYLSHSLYTSTKVHKISVLFVDFLCIKSLTNSAFFSNLYLKYSEQMIELNRSFLDVKIDIKKRLWRWYFYIKMKSEKVPKNEVVKTGNLLKISG